MHFDITPSLQTCTRIKTLKITHHCSAQSIIVEKNIKHERNEKQATVACHEGASFFHWDPMSTLWQTVKIHRLTACLTYYVLEFHCSGETRLLSVIQLRDADPQQSQGSQHETTNRMHVLSALKCNKCDLKILVIRDIIYAKKKRVVQV